MYVKIKASKRRDVNVLADKEGYIELLVTLQEKCYRKPFGACSACSTTSVKKLSRVGWGFLKD